MLWHRMEWKEGMVWGFCLKDLNRKGSGKGEGKIRRTHMVSGSWNPLKHMHLMLVACGSVCSTNLRVHMSIWMGCRGRIGAVGGSQQGR